MTAFIFSGAIADMTKISIATSIPPSGTCWGSGSFTMSHTEAIHLVSLYCGLSCDRRLVFDSVGNVPKIRTDSENTLNNLIARWLKSMACINNLSFSSSRGNVVLPTCPKLHAFMTLLRVISMARSRAFLVYLPRNHNRVLFSNERWSLILVETLVLRLTAPSLRSSNSLTIQWRSLKNLVVLCL
jgi:hypothetical protein